MKHQSHGNHSPYIKHGIELAADFVVMYLVMYTMIASLDHFRFNINNVYMTLMMVTAMALLMLVGMWHMFPSKRLNLGIASVAVVVFVASFFAMRTQSGVGNEQFLLSMIPHHSGAILMCEKASITDPEIQRLCNNIIESQQREIAQMEDILERRY